MTNDTPRTPSDPDDRRIDPMVAVGFGVTLLLLTYLALRFFLL